MIPLPPVYHFMGNLPITAMGYGITQSIFMGYTEVRHRRDSVMSISDQIQNYYENKVVDAIHLIAEPKGYNQEQLTDLACLALNNLPTRYYRHEVDLAFYMSAQEHTEINQRVEKAVRNAIAYLEKNKK